MILELLDRPAKDARTDLIKAQTGRDRNKVNACPYDKDFKHLDENGYCRHLIGTSNDKKTYEPMHRNPKTGGRVTKCRTVPTEEIVFFDDGFGKPVKEVVMRPVLDPIPKGAVVVPISTSYRVYFDVDKSRDQLEQQRLDLTIKAQNAIPKEVMEGIEEVAEQQGLVVDKNDKSLQPEKSFIV